MFPRVGWVAAFEMCIFNVLLKREAESVEEKLLRREEELKVQESVLKEVEAKHDMEQAARQMWRSHLEGSAVQHCLS